MGLGTVTTRFELEEIGLSLWLSLRRLVNLDKSVDLTKTQYFHLLTGNSINNTYHMHITESYEKVNKLCFV